VGAVFAEIVLDAPSHIGRHFVRKPAATVADKRANTGNGSAAAKRRERVTASNLSYFKNVQFW
jgi:hypothetical protein